MAVSRDPAALLRGVATAGLTATLAVAAHTHAGGTTATGPVTVGLAVVAVTVGALAATLRRADRMPVLVVLLAAGQLAGHAVLGATDHAHAAAGGPAASMPATHLAAVAAGAALIALGGRLCAALSRAARAAARRSAPHPPEPVAVRSTRHAHRSLQSPLMLAGPVSHRGPPVSAAR